MIADCLKHLKERFHMREDHDAAYLFFGCHGDASLCCQCPAFSALYRLKLNLAPWGCGASLCCQCLAFSALYRLKLNLAPWGCGASLCCQCLAFSALYRLKLKLAPWGCGVSLCCQCLAFSALYRLKLNLAPISPGWPLTAFQEWEGRNLICAFASVAPGRLSQMLETNSGHIGKNQSAVANPQHSYIRGLHSK
ncbi:unnamed protein product [Polarella glacialis]|uniref:Uncharacterized protein n=1 Tax=Polarella glacialis TaxID=89957 RepID=A0A813ITW6_POLGL|nr:unnamed protein product [Polarella glacialis]